MNTPLPTALVITAAGINCDRELVEAFSRAGASVESVHLRRLLDDPSIVDRFDLVGLPGGFSYGDAVAAGRIAASLLQHGVKDALVRAVDRGVPMIAPCNGFQIAVQLGLLPGGGAGGSQRSVTLAPNASGRFVDRWSRMEYPSETRCIWTKDLDPAGAVNLLPSAHGEGRFLAADDAVIERLESAGQVAIRYAADENFNGSAARIAGICDETGLVFGLMPHPERYTRWTQHPWWTRLDAADLAGDPPGLQMFRNAVAVAEQTRRERANVSAGAVVA
ncbi:MAG: phosphoribosylformylglycinamidine synthase subunit PurQ [Phycisphaerales bacterium]